jgi:hypothetical protein
MRHWLRLLILPAALFTVAACGGNEDADGVTAATVGTGDGDPTTTASATAQLDAPAALTESLIRLQASSYRMSYEFTTTIAGQSLQGTLTWVRAGDGRSRSQTVATQAGQTITLAVIVDAEGEALLCMTVDLVGSCFDLATSPVGDPVPNPAELILEGLTDPDRLPRVAFSGSETILGIDTDCYAYDGPDGAGEACISARGVMLRGEWSDSTQNVLLNGTSFSDDVSDEDFEPPQAITG